MSQQNVTRKAEASALPRIDQVQEQMGSASLAGAGVARPRASTEISEATQSQRASRSLDASNFCSPAAQPTVTKSQSVKVTTTSRVSASAAPVKLAPRRSPILQKLIQWFIRMLAFVRDWILNRLGRATTAHVVQPQRDSKREERDSKVEKKQERELQPKRSM